ncbi:putative Ribosome biogenesis protein NEP1 [Giardia muris]|uniref:Putative Ribosome biogenesis protein NEP1 n=1 Tax=Giardia muris TaxID=5742 RepID=A0A4Z1SY30_GIAMU|nr:putative Ribosome biogenesis protein NEP1 [Giardia muris]|eukprot:TNJ28418.1 putative Ribosome biogenesis protein NEP1 [Giardia muris]
MSLPAPRFDSTTRETRLIVILEQAFLETVKHKEKYQLLNVDDHHVTLKKTHRPPEAARPDITHQALLALLDSPLNKAGLLEVWVHTANNVIIRIDPSVRLPRTFKRFCGLIVQLLHKMVIRADDSNRKLLHVVKGPLIKHIPADIPIVLLSRVAGEPVSLKELALRLTKEQQPPTCQPIAVVIGAIAHGHISIEYATEKVSISNYALSAAAVASRLCTAFEEVWSVL